MNNDNNSKARELLKNKAITNFDDHGHFIDHQALAEADPNRTWSIYYGGWVGGVVVVMDDGGDFVICR